nr:6480_t:CDS:2 [Entrophospora candida]
METPEEMGDKSSSSSTRAEKWSIYHVPTRKSKNTTKSYVVRRRMVFHLDIIDVLCPFYGFTRILGSSDYYIVSLVYPLIKYIKEKYKNTANDVHEMDFESADVVFDVIVMNMPRW